MPEKKLLIGCLLMAAGTSERFEAGNKLLYNVEGEPMISYPVRRLTSLKNILEKEGLVLELLAVTRWPEVRELCGSLQIPCIMYEGGPQSETIRTGLRAAEKRQWDGCLFMTGDQPFVSETSLRKLAGTFAMQPDHICRLAWKGQPGSPVIFPSSCFYALKNLQGDEGGRQVIRASGLPVTLVEAQTEAEMMDIDTLQDYENLRKA